MKESLVLSIVSILISPPKASESGTLYLKKRKGRETCSALRPQSYRYRQTPRFK